MAAPQQARPLREEISFPPNIAVTVNMKFAQPKLVGGAHGERYLFTTADNRVFFLDPEVAGQIEALGINVRENFTITRKSSGKQGDAATWEVARLPGEQPNGTYVVPRDPEAAAEAPAPKPPARAEHISSMTLTEEAKAVIDAYAEVLAHGLTTHSGKIKPDEIQRIFTTVYIQRQGAA